jgi:hypothetical protein
VRWRQRKVGGRRQKGVASPLDRLNSLRERLCQVIRRRKQQIKVKDPKRIYTPAAYKEEFGRELEDDKLEAKWIFAKGRWVWGTLVRRNKEGVLDVSDNDVEEIEERSVIDDGHDLVRAGQLEAKYQHACQSFTDFSGTAATVADAALPDWVRQMQRALPLGTAGAGTTQEAGAKGSQREDESLSEEEHDDLAAPSAPPAFGLCKSKPGTPPLSRTAAPARAGSRQAAPPLARAAAPAAPPAGRAALCPATPQSRPLCPTTPQSQPVRPRQVETNSSSEAGGSCEGTAAGRTGVAKLPAAPAKRSQAQDGGPSSKRWRSAALASACEADQSELKDPLTHFTNAQVAAAHADCGLDAQKSLLDNDMDALAKDQHLKALGESITEHNLAKDACKPMLEKVAERSQPLAKVINKLRTKAGEEGARDACPEIQSRTCSVLV